MREAPQTYAITVVCADRERVFLHSNLGQTMVTMLSRYRLEGRFLLHAFVVMPDHLHLVISPTSSLEATVGLIKGGFSFAVRKVWRGPVWQESYYAHRVVSPEDYDSQVSYIANNPARQALSNYPHVHTMHGEMVDPRPTHLGG